MRTNGTMRQCLTELAAAVAVLGLLAPAVFAQQQAAPATDVLYMRDGEEFIGRLADVAAGEVVFSLAEGGDRTFALSEVQRVELGESRPGSSWRHVGDIEDPALVQALQTAAGADSAYARAGHVTLYRERAYVLDSTGVARNTERVIRKVLLERGKQVANGARHYLSENSKATLDFGRTVTPEGQVVPVSDAAIQDGSVYSDFPDYENLHRKNWALKKVKEGAVVDYQTTVVERTGLLAPFYVEVAFGDDEPTVREVLRVTVPDEVPCTLDTLRFGRGQYSKAAAAGTTVHTWTLEDLPELISEDSMPVRPDLWPRVALAPQRSWQRLGKAYAEVLRRHLNGDRTLKGQAKALTRGLKGRADKARALYEFVVKDIRTVPVPYPQYSLEPKDISDTFRKRYGNNLDKSLLYLGLLDEVGIRANLCLIRPQEAGALMDVPSLAQFGDCLVCVRVKHDSIYVSVTDDRLPFGALEGEHQNVKGLLVDRMRSGLITTPLLPAKDEAEERALRIEVSEDGTFTVHETARYSGQSALGLRAFKAMKDEELEKTFQQSVGAVHPNAQMVEYAISDLNDLSTPAGYDLTYRIGDYALAAGESLMAFKLPDLEYSASSVGKATRLHALDWTTRVSETSRYTVAIPEGFKVYYLPASVRFETPFLTYRAAFEEQDGQIVFSDAFERRVIQAPASAYAQYKEGIEARAQLAEEWIVLERE